MMHTFTCRRCDGEWAGEKRRGQTPFYCEPCRPLARKERDRRNAEKWQSKRRENRDLINQWKRDDYAANKARYRGYQLKVMYNISSERYAELLESQGGVCAVCHNVCATGRVLAVDHDRNCCPETKSCGECIRGLLCRSCNSLLLVGYERLPEALRDSPRLNAYLSGVLERDPLLAEAS